MTYLLEAESILPADIAVSADNWPRGYALGSLLDYDPLQRSRSGIFSKKINSIGVFGTHPIFNDPAPLLESAGKSKIPPPSILGGKIPTIAMARGHLAYCRYLYNYCDPNYEDIPEKMVKDAAIYARKAWKTAAEAAEKAGEVCPSDLLDKLCRAIMHNQFGIRHVDVSFENFWLQIHIYLHIFTPEPVSYPICFLSFLSGRCIYHGVHADYARLR